MHETGVVRDLVRKLDTIARDAGAVRVCGVSVRLGALSGFSAEHFQTHFLEDASGTLAESARLCVVVSEDVSEPHAQHVLIENVELEIPDEGE